MNYGTFEWLSSNVYADRTFTITRILQGNEAPGEPAIMEVGRSHSWHSNITREVNNMADESAASENGWEEQESTGVWIPKEEGQELVGEVTDIVEGTYGLQYIIKTDKEETRTPSHKVLQNRMGKAKKGDTVKIVYKGEEPPAVKGQNPTRMYDVFIKKK